MDVLPLKIRKTVANPRCIVSLLKVGKHTWVQSNEGPSVVSNIVAVFCGNEKKKKCYYCWFRRCRRRRRPLTRVYNYPLFQTVIVGQWPVFKIKKINAHEASALVSEIV
jgi:hypothetical protein